MTKLEIQIVALADQLRAYIADHEAECADICNERQRVIAFLGRSLGLNTAEDWSEVIYEARLGKAR